MAARAPVHSKVKAAGAAGAVGTLAVFVAAALGYSLSPEVVSAAVALLATAAGYLMPSGR